MTTENVHILSEKLLHRAVEVHVIGCGGTGSQLLPRLAQLSKCMVALGQLPASAPCRCSAPMA